MELIVTTKEQLSDLISDAINKALGERTETATIKPEIIDRPELCKRLSVTRQTIDRWERKGVIPSLRIGSNVRYNWPAVISALENPNKKGK